MYTAESLRQWCHRFVLSKAKPVWGWNWLDFLASASATMWCLLWKINESFQLYHDYCEFKQHQTKCKLTRGSETICLDSCLFLYVHRGCSEICPGGFFVVSSIYRLTNVRASGRLICPSFHLCLKNGKIATDPKQNKTNSQLQKQHSTNDTEVTTSAMQTIEQDPYLLCLKERTR